MLGQVTWLARREAAECPPGEIPSLAVARNDQHPVGRWPVVMGADRVGEVEGDVRIEAGGLSMGFYIIINSLNR